ncbi:MAG: hypothetical protein ACNS60_13835 [Candidatus Cyclobacteriaceae bacterium M2_1C_046]
MAKLTKGQEFKNHDKKKGCPDQGTSFRELAIDFWGLLRINIGQKVVVILPWDLNSLAIVSNAGCVSLYTVEAFD